MNSPSYLRFPHVCGDLLTCVAEDDVWAAPLDGGRAWRVSADQVPASHPRISPDGTQVAWASTRDGAPEVHLAPVDGGAARRLTYWGVENTAPQGWLPATAPDGEPEIVVVSPQGRRSALHPWAHAVPTDGGPARTLPYGPVSSAAHGPDGGVLLSSAGQSRGRDAARWKRYRGGTAGKLWIDTEGGGTFHRVHAGLNGNLESPMWAGGRIAFLSDHEGTGAVYSSLPDGGDLRRHTPLDRGYARQATTDGTRVIYACRGELWLLDNLDGAEPRPLDVRLTGQRTARQPHPVPTARHLGDIAPDHTGRGSAMEVRGALYWVTHQDGPVRALAAEPGVRARLPRAFRTADSDQVLWVTDSQGEDALALRPAAPGPDAPEPRLLAAGQLGRVRGLEVAPDGSRAAVGSHDGRVLLVELSDGAVHELDRSGNGEVSGLVFSPDSRWLAWSHPGTSSLRQLKIANTTVRSVSEATPLRFQDTCPAFTRDGKHLAFLSERTFDPVYDSHVFDLTFVATSRPYLLTLAADTPSPFGPQRHGRPVNPADAQADGAGAAGGGQTTAQAAASAGTASGEESGDVAPETRVDLDGLADRAVPFPVEAGRYSALRAAHDGVLWLSHPVNGNLGTSWDGADGAAPQTSLRRYDLNRLRSSTVARKASGYRVTGDGKLLVLRSGNTVRVVPADCEADKLGEDDDRNVKVDLRRVRVTVDPTAEWRQMYEETGRVMRDNFWRADMDGVDWDGVLAEYRPVLERVATHDDLVDLLWEVHGELHTSHAYVVPEGRTVAEARRQGLLGADLSRHEDGAWRIDRILPSETSDPDARSPLTAPGVAVRPGDALVAVDGVLVDPHRGPSPLLAGTADHDVELTVAPGDGGPQRHVIVTPVASEDALRYHDWVHSRREIVRERSGGRLGYLHVPDMVSTGWAQLHRDLRSEMVKDGLVLDVRENRGGHTSQLVVEKLARQVIGWDVARDGEATTYPGDARRGPMVALANEHSGSDGDIVTAAIRRLGLGPVIGTRTWGGVIGIDSKYSLVDGTLITQPKFSYWFDHLGWDVENYGVEPDIELPVPPQDHVAGHDPQLEEGIRLVLEALETTPPLRAPRMPPPRGGHSAG